MSKAQKDSKKDSKKNDKKYGENKKYNKKYTLDTLEKILKTPSPTGMTDQAVQFVQKEFEKLGYVTKITPKGALLAAPDKNSLVSPETVFTAHVDTLGLMVRKITGPNKLMMTKIGSYEYKHVEGEYATVHTTSKKYTGTVMPVFSSVHAHTQAERTMPDNDQSYEIRLDTDFKDLEEMKKSDIRVGDFISLDERCRITPNGFICSRHLDDKAGVAALLCSAEYLASTSDNNNDSIFKKGGFAFFISTHEEIGHGGAPIISPSVKYLIAVDMAVTSIGQESSEKCVTICAKDSSGPYDLFLKNRLLDVAEKENIEIKLDIYPFYGSDASAALRAGHNIRAGLIGPGVDSSHSYERTHIDGILNTSALITAFLKYSNQK